MRDLFLLAAVLAPRHLVAQRLAPVPAYTMSSFTAATRGPLVERVRSDSAAVIPRTYWLEGGVISAVAVGVLGTLWFRGMSDTRPGIGSTIGVAALCSAAGFGPGALIGGQFRKPQRRDGPSIEVE